MSHQPAPSHQTRFRFWKISLAVGLWGWGFLSIPMLLEGGPWTDLVWLFLAGFTGAFLGGMATTWAFGRAGPLGWLIATIGGVIATFLGAIACGTLLIPGLGTVFGPLLAWVLVTGSALGFGLWLVGLLLVQVYALRWAPFPKPHTGLPDSAIPVRQNGK